MRRTSIITTILLILVIIALIVALIVTNLPEKEEVTNPEGEQVVGEEVVDGKEEPETPNYLALDSDIAKDMTKMLEPCRHMGRDKDYFYKGKVGITNPEDLTDVAKMEIACYYAGSEIEQTEPVERNGEVYPWKLKKSDLDNVMLKIFGNIDYTPQDFYVYRYFPDEEMFYGAAKGGGGPVPSPIIGTYKVEEYSDRYEVYQKYLLSVPGDWSDGYATFTILEWNSYTADVVVNYTCKPSSANVDLPEGVTPYFKNFDKLIEGVEMKAFTPYETWQEDNYKLLSKYYDQATEYKHTFMKNEDGTYYWVKSEIIK